MRDLSGKTAFITGGASGLGLAMAHAFGGAGMNVMLADIEEAPLAAAVAELEARQVRTASVLCDVGDRAAVVAAAQATVEAFGKVHLVCNNAGVGSGGLVWENSVQDWEWVMGVNVWGVIHGVRLFTPMMLEAAQKDPAWQGHIVNTASMAGLLTPPNMGVYNVSKTAVVSLSETLYQDLRLVTDQIGASVLCPYFVPTGINQSHRNKPSALADEKPTRSQLIGQAMTDKAVGSGKLTAADVAQMVFDAVAQDQFYIFSHPRALGNVQRRMEAIVSVSNPPDAFAERPEIGEMLKAQLRAGG